MNSSNPRLRDTVYFDSDGIPLGKYNLSTNQQLKSANYVQALAQNVNL